MAITAARIGNSPIALDWAGLQRKFSPDPQTLQETWAVLKARFDSKEIGFFNAPTDDEISQASAAQKAAEGLLKKNVFTDCLFLGIGGSALGPICLLSALKEKTQPQIRFHFVENPDPMEWKSTLHGLHPGSTLVCVVSKSGSTFETLAQFLLVLEWIGKDRWSSHLMLITDPEKGELREFAYQEQVPSLSIAPSIGGRFSVFSPVGLFPAALAGLSVEKFLLGAKQVRETFEKLPLEKNPILVLGHHLLQNYPRRTVHVCMPYSTRLRQFGLWFTQLWGESLGKNNKGFTPVAALGATDQHSLLQLLKEGPDDKITFFLTVDQVEDKVTLPRSPQTKDRRHYPTLKLLENHSLQELLEIEYRSTATVLAKAERPYFTTRLDQLDEKSLGALFFAYSTLTAFVGTLWEVNPFDQPGVEEGKVYIRQELQKSQ